MIEFRRFDLDPTIVAPIIYRNEPQRTTEMGVVLPPQVRLELSNLLQIYTDHFVEQYYRIDAHFTADKLYVLEINTGFADGWGTALNLSRAAGIAILKEPLYAFPEKVACMDPDYLPEARLFVQEMADIPLTIDRIVHWDGLDEPSDELYVYGRVKSKFINVYPLFGYERDNKLNLAHFAQKWSGKRVVIPRHYVCDLAGWDDIPSDAVLKFCEKENEESRVARASVIIGKPLGKAQFLRRCFSERKLIAQERIYPTRHEAMNCQLIILARDSDVITRYVQYSEKEIINDNSIHGPLLIE